MIEKGEKMKQIKIVCRWLIPIIGYAFILISLSVIFPKTIYIDNAYFGLWAFCASLLIFVLNKWIKPILIRLTIPITALTFGLFYPFINLFILYITNLLLGRHFTIKGIRMGLLVAILLSIINLLMEHFIYKPILKKELKYE